MPLRRKLEQEAFVWRVDRLLLVCAGAWAVFTVFNLLRGRLLAPGLDFLLMGATLLIRRWGLADRSRLRMAAHLTLALSCLGLLLISLISGQSRALAIWFVVAAPPLAAYLLGATEAAWWAAGAGVAVLLNDFSEHLVRIPPEFVPSSLELTLGRLVLLLMLTAFSIAFRRTTEARERELTDATCQAQAANRTKSLFLANVSHELRTPLNAILGFAQVLEDEAFGPLNAKQAKFARNIHQGGEQLLAQVEDLLEFSRLEAGAQEFDRRLSRPEGLLLQVVERFRTAGEEKGVDLEIDDGAPLPELDLDPGRFVLALGKLVDNALKFTPPGGQVRLIARCVDEAVRFTVEDTGIGISPRDQERIFHPFEMVDGGYARQHRGTGLGLALARKIADLHGGCLWVNSAGPGHGSSFIMELPVPGAVRV